jgi:hypothetical protein
MLAHRIVEFMDQLGRREVVIFSRAGEDGIDVLKHCQFDSPKSSSAFGRATCGLWKYGYYQLQYNH